MKKHTMRLTLLLVFIYSISYSQAALIDRGESGATLGLGLYTGADQTDLVIGGGYSPNGLFNFSGIVQRSTLDNNFGLANAYVLGLSTQVSYFIIKQEDLPFDLSIDISGGIGKVYSDEIDALDWDVISRQSRISTSMFYKFNSTSNVKIQPYGSIGYSVDNLKVDTNGFGSNTDSNTNINFAIGANILLDLDYNKFNISPILIFRDSGTRFGVNLDYLFN